MGWVLYIPNEAALHVYDKIMEHGNKYNIQHAGYYATRSLRYNCNNKRNYLIQNLLVFIGWRDSTLIGVKILMLQQHHWSAVVVSV